MTLEMLTDFFMWCTVINVGLMLFWVLMVMAMPNLVYRMQTIFVKIDREHFDRAMYNFLGLFKVVVIVFNIVPWLTLLIMQSS